MRLLVLLTITLLLNACNSGDQVEKPTQVPILPTCNILLSQREIDKIKAVMSAEYIKLKKSYASEEESHQYLAAVLMEEAKYLSSNAQAKIESPQEFMSLFNELLQGVVLDRAVEYEIRECLSVI